MGWGASLEAANESALLNNVSGGYRFFRPAARSRQRHKPLVTLQEPYHGRALNLYTNQSPHYYPRMWTKLITPSIIAILITAVWTYYATKIDFGLRGAS